MVRDCVVFSVDGSGSAIPFEMLVFDRIVFWEV